MTREEFEKKKLEKYERWLIKSAQQKAERLKNSGKKGWTSLSRDIRKLIHKCQWCNSDESLVHNKRLEGHHLGTRWRGNNLEFKFCPMNIIVVCQPCHVLLEPYAKIVVELCEVDDLGVTIEKVKCCGKGSACTRYKDTLK